MASLAFRLLDAHVVIGRADELALVHGEESFSYAELLHESASLAGALRDLGVSAGQSVGFDPADPVTRALGFLSIVRLGAEVAAVADVFVGGRPPRVTAHGEDLGLDLVRRAGRTNPAVAPKSDPVGYEQRMRAVADDIVTTLLDGGTLG